ncbi:MAG: hypothetical protein AAFY63_19515, partial [Cyanobacteria bacterium J06643_13]
PPGRMLRLSLSQVINIACSGAPECFASALVQKLRHEAPHAIHQGTSFPARVYALGIKSADKK